MRKGFTLIKLLAVIVVISIISLIATPSVLNIIEEAKKNAFRSIAYGIMEAAKLSYAQNALNGNKVDKYTT